MKNNILSELRQQTEDTHSNRFRLFVEIVTACYANCSGCALTPLVRKNLEPEISIEQIKDIFNYFVPIINKQYNEKKHLNEMGGTSLVLGTGEYFLMKKEYLEELFKEISIFFSKLETPINVVAVSSAMMFTEEKFKEKIEIFNKYLSPEQYAIEGVIDPLELERHYDRYLKNYRDIKKYSTLFDLVINLSDKIKPDHLNIMNKLISEMDLFNIDVQYQLNGTNYFRVKTSPENFSACMNKLYESTNGVTELIDQSLALPILTDSDLEISVFDKMKQNAQSTIKERILIKSNGDMYPVGNAYGDIFLDERYEFSPIGNIHNKEFNYDDAESKVFNYLKTLFMSKKVCHTCEYNKQCYGSGYSFYNKFTQGKECDNVGRFVFENFQ